MYRSKGMPYVTLNSCGREEDCAHGKKFENKDVAGHKLRKAWL